MTIFSNSGTVSAGFIGVIIIIGGIKLIIDTIIHGYALYTVFGWSFHLIGAIWDFVTNLLLHSGKGKQNSEEQQKDQSKTNPSAPNFAINFVEENKIMSRICILITISLFLIQTNEANQFIKTALSENPNIYFEPLETLTFTTGRWHILSYVNILEVLNFGSEILNTFKELSIVKIIANIMTSHYK